MDDGDKMCTLHSDKQSQLEHLSHRHRNALPTCRRKLFADRHKNGKFYLFCVYNVEVQKREKIFRDRIVKVKGRGKKRDAMEAKTFPHECSGTLNVYGIIKLE